MQAAGVRVRLGRTGRHRTHPPIQQRVIRLRGMGYESGPLARAGEELKKGAERAGEEVTLTRREAEEGLRRAGKSVGEVYRENPLVFGAAAFVAGAALGLAIPATDRT